LTKLPNKGAWKEACTTLLAKGSVHYGKKNKKKKSVVCHAKIGQFCQPTKWDYFVG